MKAPFSRQHAAEWYDALFFRSFEWLNRNMPLGEATQGIFADAHYVHRVVQIVDMERRGFGLSILLQQVSPPYLITPCLKYYHKTARNKGPFNALMEALGATCSALALLEVVGKISKLRITVKDAEAHWKRYREGLHAVECVGIRWPESSYFTKTGHRFKMSSRPF